MKHPIFGAMFALAIFAPTIHAQSGVVMDIVATDTRDGEVMEEEVQVSVLGESIRLDVDGDEDASIIFRGETDELVIIDHDDRSYFTLSREVFTDVFGQIALMMQSLGAMVELDDDEQEELDKILDALQSLEEPAAPRPATRGEAFEATGESATFGGFPCSFYAHRDSRESRVTEICMAAVSDVDGGDEASVAITGLIDFFEGFVGSIAGMEELSGMDEDEWASPVSDLRGFMEDGLFPVGTRTSSVNGSGREEFAEVRSSRRVDLGPEVFEAPTSYRSEMPGLDNFRFPRR